MSRRRVVITGIGAVSPLGNSAKETWENAVAGKSGIDKITKFDAEKFSCKIAGEVKGFDPLNYFNPKEAKKHDDFTKYSVAATGEALKDAGCGDDYKLPYNPESVGCVLGVGIGGLAYLERNHQVYLKSGPRRISPFLIPAMITNMAPGIVAIEYGLKGVNFAVESACTSSSHAIGESARMIADGRVEMMVTGGAESAVTPMGIGGFCALKALSTKNDEPQKASRPFDKARDGFVMGEGGIVFVLESLEGAKARGADIYAEVLGYGVSCDAFHMTAPCVDGEGASRSMRLALKDAGVSPEQVSYLNAHGTSTPANDATETRAIKDVFGAHVIEKKMLVSSTKSLTGHLLGAAGAIEALFCSMAIKNSIVPPTINLDNPEEGCDLDYVAHKAREAEVKIAVSNSFGFGGTNGTLVFGKV